MEYQAEAIIEHLNFSVSVGRSRRNSDTSPIVVTTGANIEVSAKALLGRNDTLVLRTNFGHQFHVALLKPHLEADVSGISSAAVTRAQSRWLPGRRPGSLITLETPSGQPRGGG